MQAFLGVVSILHLVATVAAVYVLRWQWREGSSSADGGSCKAMQRASSLQRLNCTVRHAARDAHSWVSCALCMLGALCLCLFCVPCMLYRFPCGSAADKRTAAAAGVHIIIDCH
jgi:hypothetical protein